MKKLLAIFMTVAMIVTMFSFASVVFAEDAVEEAKPELVKYVGVNANDKKSGLANNRKNDIFVKSGNSVGACWDWEFLTTNPDRVGNNESTEVAKANIKNLVVKRNEAINEAIASGEYSAFKLLVVASADVENKAIEIDNIKGTETTPVIIEVVKAPEGSIQQYPEFKNNNTTDEFNKGPSLTIKNCENITVKDLTVSTGTYVGLKLENNKNVTVDGLTFNEVAYVDYATPVPVVDENGNEIKDESGNTVQEQPKMETALLKDKGAAIYADNTNENVTIANCKFTKCRAGVVLEGVDGATVTSCSFEDVDESAVLINGSNDVNVSGGSLKNVGLLADASDFDGRTVAAYSIVGGENNTVSDVAMEQSANAAVISLNNTKGAKVERVLSYRNKAFMINELGAGANATIRYNISVEDGSTVLSSTTADSVKFYNNTFLNASALDFSTISNLTAKNNIFYMAIGNKVKMGGGDIGNNCYYWTSKGDSKSIKKNPAFANAYTADQIADPASGLVITDNCILATGSPCLNAGVKVEEDMGTDFFGNAVTDSVNIGADAAGTGIEATQKIPNAFVDTLNYIFALIKNFFANLF